jgi:hypothetical protein
MDDLSFQQMREFIGMTENLVGSDRALLAEDTNPVEPDMVPSLYLMFEDLQNVVFKLRAFTESREGDIGLGIELGMQRAADMIENVLKRHWAGE